MMREDVLSLKALGGDPVSEEYLKADLYHRAEALKDIPDAPLFFGRLDYGPSEAGPSEAGPSEAGPSEAGPSEAGPSEAGPSEAGPSEAGPSEAGPSEAGPSESGRAGDDGVAGHSFHIGRRHVHAPDGTPAVIDWRAPVSRPFYRASSTDPMNLALRRRFGFSGGELTAYEDELFTTDRSDQENKRRTSQILLDEIERPRSGPMRDIVATIQPDQDDIVRAGAAQTVCVQGAPGTGKTAVGLHRVAYLLYAYKEQVRRRGVVMVGPNRAFLSYIRNVLPALGELDVTQTTVGKLVASAGTVAVRGADTEAAAIVKGDARMAAVLRRALWASVRRPSAALVLPRGARRWRVAAYELEELVHELRHRGVRYGAARELLEHRIAHVILTRMEAEGEACDDRTHETVRRAKPVRIAVDAIWPKADPARLVFGLLASAEALAEAAVGILTAEEQATIVWSSAPRGPGSARWSAADVVLIDEARDLITRTPSLAHVVVDEAQDLSPMECRALGRRCSTGAATVLGDLAQGTTPWAAPSWESLLSNLGKPDTEVRELSVGYRVPRQILDYASTLLAVIAPELRPASSLRADPGALDLVQVPAAALGPALVQACLQACTRPGSVAVIAADPQIPALARVLDGAGVEHGTPGSDSRLTLVPVTLAKGLEYDHVIVVEPARIASAEARGLQRLYVALTRAVSRLTVLYAESLPAPLRSVIITSA